MPLVRKSKRLPRIPANVSLARNGAEPPVAVAVVEARMGVFARVGCMASQNRTPLAAARRESGYEEGVGWGAITKQLI